LKESVETQKKQMLIETTRREARELAKQKAAEMATDVAA